MIIGKNNIKEIYNPGELDFDTMVKPIDHGDKVFIWASDINTIKYAPLAGESPDAVWHRAEEYKEKMKDIAKDYLCTVINVAMDMYNLDPNQYIRGVELMESQEEFIWKKLVHKDLPLSPSLKEALKDRVRHDYEPFNLVSNINRIFAEIIVDKDIVFQRLSFLPNFSTQLFRVGRLENGKWEFSTWQGEIWDYNFEKNHFGVISRNYIRKRYLTKDDVEKYFDSVMRWQGHEWNPNKCLKKGFYTYSKLFSKSEFFNIQNIYNGIPLYSPDLRPNADTFIGGNICNYDTYTEEVINGKVHRLIIQESEMLVHREYFAKMHRIIKVEKDNPNNYIATNWEYTI